MNMNAWNYPGNLWQSDFSVARPILCSECGSVSYHDALWQVVKNRCFELKGLSTDDGVWQGELQEEGLENCELNWWGQTKALGGQAESLSLPGGDGVRDSDGELWLSRISVKRPHVRTMAMGLDTRTTGAHVYDRDWISSSLFIQGELTEHRALLQQCPDWGYIVQKNNK